jgi:hypothetical protein
MENLDEFLHRLVHHSSAPEAEKQEMHDKIDGVEPEPEPAKFDPDTGEPLNDAARAKRNAPADSTPVTPVQPQFDSATGEPVNTAPGEVTPSA